ISGRGSTGEARSPGPAPPTPRGSPAPWTRVSPLAPPQFPVRRRGRCLLGVEERAGSRRGGCVAGKGFWLVGERRLACRRVGGSRRHGRVLLRVGGVWPRHQKSTGTGAASSSARTPIPRVVLIFSSISFARSGLSLRKFRTFSLP